jgi:hypothetical protein
MCVYWLQATLWVAQQCAQAGSDIVNLPAAFAEQLMARLATPTANLTTLSTFLPSVGFALYLTIIECSLGLFQHALPRPVAGAWCAGACYTPANLSRVYMHDATIV